MATWPSLPAPLVSGYQESTPDTLLRTQMDQGPAKVRRRTTAGVRDFSLSFLLTAAQVSTLETFFLTTVNGGADSFTMDHPRTGVSSTFRFKGPPSYVAVGNAFRANISMELLP